MSLASDLLEQAEHLARRESAKPRQASLRRALSAAYYALFHHLVDESRTFLLGRARQRAHLRDVLARSYEHRRMFDAAQEVARSKSPWLEATARVSGDLRKVAQTFAQSQRDRHAADYDLARKFTRIEVLTAITRVRHALTLWQRVKREPQAEAFLMALLLKGRSAS